MFENKFIESCHTHYSRIIASWVKAGGTFTHPWLFSEFAEWIRSLPVDITEEQIYEMYEMATNGKLEFEILARRYLEKANKEEGSF
jgi:hypothetical protein